ncbi:MAG: MarC family protein [Bacteroidales bacterium]|nr:MarC family protein [Bacteroidales bacterium]
MFSISITQIIGAFLALFAIIDILGSVPIILGLQQRGEEIKPLRTTLVSIVIFVAFLFAGDLILRLFSVDTQSFAVAGSLVLFIMALEMILGIDIIRYNGPKGSSSVVPLAFPLVAGPGSITAILSMRAEYDMINILIALILNIVWVYVVLKSTKKIHQFIGEGAVYIMRKFFGIILLAMSVKLFASNISSLL